MTFTEAFSPDEEQEFIEAEDYPSAFGITFTPTVSGVALGLLGVLVTFYIILTWGIPAYQQYRELKSQEASKQEQIERQKTGRIDKKIQRLEGQLKQAEAAKSKVQSLFASDQSFDTLLFDINKIANRQKVKIVSFQLRAEKKSSKAKEPENTATIVDDGSLGKQANKHLKRQRIDLEVRGNFKNTQAFLQDLERLQTLVSLKDINIALNPEQIDTVYVDEQKNVKTGSESSSNIKTTMMLEVLIPLTPNELAKAKSAEEDTENKATKKDKKDKKTNTKDKAEQKK